MHFAKRNLVPIAAAGLFLAATAARADEWDKRTIVTINDAVQLPNVVLQPGSYVFKLLDSPSDRHIVQVFDKNEQHLITTVLAINNYRLEPAGKSIFTFWETPAGNPPALRAWFYPGDEYGQEFAYPKNMATQLAKANRMSVPTAEANNSSDMKTAKITSTSEMGDQNQLDKKTYSNSTMEKTAEATAPSNSPAPAATSTDTQSSSVASNNSSAATTTTTAQQTTTDLASNQTSASNSQASNDQTAANLSDNQSSTAQSSANNNASDQSSASQASPTPSQVPSELPHTASDMPLVGLLGIASLAAYVALSRKTVR
jgi:hypothetical protein